MDDLAKAIELSLKETSKPTPTASQEEDDLAKAIELSLKETSPKAVTGTKQTKSSTSALKSSLYPRFNDALASLTLSDDSVSALNQGPASKEPYKVRALYDFEAAEDNELTFKAGEIILVADDSDANWWKGSNHRGDGLFPASFVTTNLDEPEHSLISRKSVQFDEDVKVKVLEREARPVEIDPEKIDHLLHLILEADPTGRKPDSDELIQLEEQCIQMNHLIDRELEKIDKNHAALTTVNQQLTEALNLYHSLMFMPPFM
ncbi:signal transducing adapter molecule 1-like isoform X2 [Brevipalpus obovatus]|uniref:signal transducing adapter molecule 1-like isoform X2 n=1 Tax=Brevipalpus obovatus TaxID=246614 RepID=UPI003D9F7002